MLQEGATEIKIDMDKIDMSKIPRRLRRFFRNKELLVKKLSKGFDEIKELKEIQKQQILAELKAKLEEAEREDLITIAKHISEQLSKERARDILEAQIRSYSGSELSKKELEEIANNVYEQIKEQARKTEVEKREKPVKKIQKKKPTLGIFKKKQKEESKNKGEDEEILELLAGREEKVKQEDEKLFEELEKLSSE